MKDILSISKGNGNILKTRWGIIPVFTAIFIAGLVIGLFLKPGGVESPVKEPVLTAEPEGKTLFWTCSMHPNIQRQKPGKCPICGMDLIPVSSISKDKEMGGMRQIVISNAVRELMKIQTTPVERRYVTAEVRMVGRVDYDETRLGYITAWISGRLDRLYVDYTGVEVKKGDHMVFIYSPELYSTQDELIQVLKRSRKREGETSIFPDVADLVGPVRERLRLWGMTKEQIQEIEKSEKPSDHLTIYSPMSGIVIQKNRQEGDYVNVGDRIYKIADLSQVWVMLDAYESDLVWLRYGQEVTFTTEAYPGEHFIGKIAFIDPVLNEKTRTVKVRVNVPNLSGKLKPNMFVHGVVRTQISTGGRVMDPYLVGKWISPMHPEIVKDKPGECDICGMPLVQAESLGYVSVDDKEATKPLVIPVSAALVTGTRAIVYVEIPDTDEPTFEGREIVLGPRAGDYYLVKSGLKEGEMVVTHGNFKIDSAVQILAKPSMMTPEGGGGGQLHDHGEKISMTEHEKTSTTAHAPEEFRKQLQKLELAYEAIEKAMKTKEMSLIHSEFQAFGKVLDEVDGGLLSGHLRMLWNELSMLLNNDVVEGMDVKQFKEADRVFMALTKNMRRIREKFGTSYDAEGSHLSHQLEVPAEFKSQLVKLWEAYLSLQKALSNDNFSLAQQAVTHFQTTISDIDDKSLAEDAHQVWKKENYNLIQALQSMKRAENLKSIRENFSLLSDTFLVLINTFGPDGFRSVYRLHCPMVFDGKGAMWLQEDKEVSNPYFGQVMLKCGDRIKLISDGKMEEYKGEYHHAQHLEVTAVFKLQLVKLWEVYLSLQQALASDNLSLAQQAATHFQTIISDIDIKSLAEDAHQIWSKENSNLIQVLQSMGQAENLKSIREDFSLLSDVFLALISTFGPDGFGTVYKLHCPMAISGKGALWLQKEKQVRNPYFGPVMLKCADLVEIISSLPVRSTQTGEDTGVRKEEHRHE